jgi:hypothetical protein
MCALNEATRLSVATGTQRVDLDLAMVDWFRL